MKRNLIILIIAFIFFFNLIEPGIEKLIKQKNIYKNASIKSLLISYLYNKNHVNGNTHLKKLSSKFFKLYNDLHFLILKNDTNISFVANKNSSYNQFLSGFLSSLKNSNYLKKNLSIKIDSKNYIYFTMIKEKNIDVIAGFIYKLNIWNIIQRNIIISLILICLYAFFILLKKNSTKEFNSEVYENIKSEPEYEIKSPLINSVQENYKNLHEDNQKLIEELENLTTFREVGLAINSILNFNQMLHAIMGVVISKLDVQKIIIYFINEDTMELTGKIGQMDKKIIDEKDLIDEKIRINEGPMGRAMEYHTPIILSDNSNNTLLLCPLIAQGNLIGAIKISNKIGAGSFDDKDKELLKLLSSQIAIALNNARLYEMAITDGLTKLYVHRHFQYKLEEELQRHRRNKKPLSLIMLDIDHFKQFNDTNGHQTGDFVLQELSKILKSMFRITDSAFRYGGEEMAVILPETTSENAYILAEKLRNNVEHHSFQFNSNTLQVTISIGLATYNPVKNGYNTKEELIKMADEALYFSKNNGRNKTTLHNSQINNTVQPNEQYPEKSYTSDNVIN